MANEKRLIKPETIKLELAFIGCEPKHLAAVDRCAIVDAVEVVRCKDCKHRGEEFECPMYFVKEIEWDDDGYTEYDYVPYDHTLDDGFCDRGERREGE